MKLSNEAYMLVLTVRKMPINNTNQGCSWVRAIQLEHNGCCSWECGGESVTGLNNFERIGGRSVWEYGNGCLQQIIWTFS